LDRENTIVHFLTEHVFGPLGGMTTFEEYEGPENSLLFIVELLQGQVNIEGAGVQECMAVVTFSTEVWRTEELGTCLLCCQSGEEAVNARGFPVFFLNRSFSNY